MTICKLKRILLIIKLSNIRENSKRTLFYICIKFDISIYFVLYCLFKRNHVTYRKYNFQLWLHLSFFFFLLYKQKVQATLYLAEITVRAADKFDKKSGWRGDCWDNRTSKWIVRRQWIQVQTRENNTGKKGGGRKREKESVCVFLCTRACRVCVCVSPLIPPFNPFMRTGITADYIPTYPGICNGAYDASRQNNDLDFNTFAFITPGHFFCSRFAIQAVSSFAISHFAELLSLSYECSTRTDGARFIAVEMWRD